MDNNVIDDSVEAKDILVSAGKQHAMINLWRALNKSHVDAQTYASFEGFLAFLRRSYQQATASA